MKSNVHNDLFLNYGAKLCLASKAYGIYKILKIIAADTS